MRVHVRNKRDSVARQACARRERRNRLLAEAMRKHGTPSIAALLDLLEAQLARRSGSTASSKNSLMPRPQRSRSSWGSRDELGTRRAALRATGGRPSAALSPHSTKEPQCPTAFQSQSKPSAAR